MYAGRVVEYATLAAITADPHHPYTRGLLACVPRLDQRRASLQTVRAFVDSAEARTPIIAAGASFTPWWPRHAPPSPEHAYALIERSPNHWVGVWAEPGRAPDRPPLIAPD
jgi:ABC-type dipeptide/oligopeptide/nickel transport system ATPase component